MGLPPLRGLAPAALRLHLPQHAPRPRGAGAVLSPVSSERGSDSDGSGLCSL